MPKKKPRPETEPQIERFRRAVREIEADGGLSPTADDDFERVFQKIAPPQGHSTDE